MLRAINNTHENARSFAGTIKARADLKSGAFREILDTADFKMQPKNSTPLSHITVHTLQNIIDLFADTPNTPADHTAIADIMPFEQRETLTECTELMQTRLSYLRMALQLHTSTKEFIAPALLKI